MNIQYLDKCLILNSSEKVFQKDEIFKNFRQLLVILNKNNILYYIILIKKKLKKDDLAKNRSKDLVHIYTVIL